MSKKWSIAILAVAFVAAGSSSAVVSTAQAQWYVSGNAGAAMLSDSDVTVSGSGPNGTSEVEFDNGYGPTGAVGYSWGALD